MEVNLYNTNKKYNVIYADPPWSYQQWCDKKQGAAKAHYETMKQKDIEELPVERIADKNCRQELHIIHVGDFPEIARGSCNNQSVGV